MKRMIIDGVVCEFDTERNVLEVAKRNHIDIPNLCYCDKLPAYGGCRLCVVETERGSVESSCTLVPQDGMTVRTNTARLRKHRQMILELLLAGHRADCAVCEKSDDCKLRQYASRYGVRAVRFNNDFNKGDIDLSSPAFIFDPSKCILCGKCVGICSEVQNVHAIDFAGRGIATHITRGFGKKLSETECVSCGQCAVSCPTAALVIKNEVSSVWKALHNSRTSVAVQVSPAVACALGEKFAITSPANCMGKIITALKLLGADYVFDGSAGYELFAEKQAQELKAKSSDSKALPLISSACPATVKRIETHYPELLSHLSECDSPMALLGAKIKDLYSDEELYSIAVEPCAAAKAEIRRPDFEISGEKPVDLVITANELAAMIKEAGIDLIGLNDSMPDGDFAFSDAAKAAVISGGIVKMLEKSGEFKAVSCSGLKNADALFADILSGKCSYDYVEADACPGACVAGGGQPAGDESIYEQREAALSL